MTENAEIIWALTAAKSALAEGDVALCGRYVEKALEKCWCAYCHEPLAGDKPYVPHFKGFVHADCRERYRGRVDYLRQHPGSANSAKPTWPRPRARLVKVKDLDR